MFVANDQISSYVDVKTLLPFRTEMKLLEGKYRGTIHKSDLERRHPYNTYLNTGLPPGPITNPGKASIDAAMHPAQTDALYFVARADGPGHVFSSTAAAHLRAVQSYRAKAN